MQTKSATTAGLLGIFLGAFGAHNWYLGEKGKGIAHVCMVGSGILVQIIASAVLPNVLTWSALLTWASILSILSVIAMIAISASGIWGLVEGIIILTQGDAGLARKGYAVAEPVPPMQGYAQPMGYGQPMNNYGPIPQQGAYGQPMPGQQPMGQPMPGQGYYGQPMQQPMQPTMQQPMQPNTPNNMMPEEPNMSQTQEPNSSMDGNNNGQ